MVRALCSSEYSPWSRKNNSDLLLSDYCKINFVKIFSPYRPLGMIELLFPPSRTVLSPHTLEGGNIIRGSPEKKD